MPTYIFILLHLTYLLFLIFLINTYIKHIGDENNNEILKINSNNIFIPKNTTHNEIYIDNLNNLYKNDKINFKIKYINILPYGDILISKNGLWNLLIKKYNKNELYKYFPKTFILEQLYSRLDFEKTFYSYFNNLGKIKQNKIIILKKNLDKKNLDLFFIKNKSNLIDIYGLYFNNYFNVIQEFINNPYLYQNKIVILKVYLIIKKIPKKDYIFKRIDWIKCVYCTDKYNIKNINNKNSFISDSKYYEKNYPKNLNELILDINIKNKILKKIDYIFNLIKTASTELIFKNNILENSIQFQLYECDFILNNSYNPFLLKFNKNPELNNNYNKNEENIKKKIISNMYDFIKNNK